MTDARLPDQWLGHPRFEGVQPEAWLFFTNCLMWSNRYGTDGRVPMGYAHQLAHGWNLEQILMQLENAEVCVNERTHVQFLWEELGQSLASEVEARRERNRDRQRIKRERDITRDITRDIGQGRLGKDDIF
jgi:hypothetical protein